MGRTLLGWGKRGKENKKIRVEFEETCSGLSQALGGQEGADVDVRMCV